MVEWAAALSEKGRAIKAAQNKKRPHIAVRPFPKKRKN
jgi:hypothetical protein